MALQPSSWALAQLLCLMRQRASIWVRLVQERQLTSGRAGTLPSTSPSFQEASTLYRCAHAGLCSPCAMAKAQLLNFFDTLSLFSCRLVLVAWCS